MIVEHSRFEIWNQLQHPFKHSLADFGYVNEALPGVSNVESALNYFAAAIYPVYRGSVATPGDLPTVGNTLNDYRVVQDDGDGKQAGYRWEQREGDVAAKWYKVFDVDWSTDGILAGLQDIVYDVYVFQGGKSDLDETGTPITGTFAGQRIWGGNLTGQNLTLDANSVDDTGFVQVNSNFRPTVNNGWDLGTATEAFKDGFFAGNLNIGTLLLSGGSITDSSGNISFGDENLSTTGNISGALGTFNYMTLAEIATPANPAAGFNSLYFKSDDKLYRLASDGTEALVGLNFTSSNDNRLVKSDGTGGDAIQETSIIIDDSNNATGFTSIGVGNLSLTGNTIASTDLNGAINLTPNGSGKVVLGTTRVPGLGNDNLFVPRVDGTLTSTGVSLSAANEMSGLASLAIDNLFFDGNTISTVAGDLSLSGFTGEVAFASKIMADADNTRDFGDSSTRFKSLFLAGNIDDGTNAFEVSELMSLRSVLYRDNARTQAAQAGDSLFYDAVNGVWLASAPDTEISHPSLSNLTIGDAGHTQFAMLAGRSGGQSIIGGTGASENLTLTSTSNATKGNIIFADSVRPDADASFSGGWQGKDLGLDSFRFRNLYMRGEAFGFRPANYTSGTLPASSANNAGHLVFATDNNKLYVDTGTSFIVAGVSKFIQDIAFDGIATTVNVDVSSSIVDARTAIIQLLDNSNDYERMHVTVKATSASNVRIETNIPLPAGSYRLVVLE